MLPGLSTQFVEPSFLFATLATRGGVREASVDEPIHLIIYMGPHVVERVLLSSALSTFILS
jgi:hypothetical protein